jgi:hypothetical protein
MDNKYFYWIVNKTKFGTVSRVLVRNASATAVATSVVKVYVKGSGYASSRVLNTLPTVSRGFALFSSQPLNGPGWKYHHY